MVTHRNPQQPDEPPAYRGETLTRLPGGERNFRRRKDRRLDIDRRPQPIEIVVADWKGFLAARQAYGRKATIT
jgi:hypothetical protein